MFSYIVSRISAAFTGERFRGVQDLSGWRQAAPRRG
jgi:hypothetical protein